jgi:hypothetical protein
LGVNQASFQFSFGDVLSFFALEHSVDIPFLETELEIAEGTSIRCFLFAPICG